MDDIKDDDNVVAMNQTPQEIAECLENLLVKAKEGKITAFVFGYLTDTTHAHGGRVDTATDCCTLIGILEVLKTSMVDMVLDQEEDSEPGEEPEPEEEPASVTHLTRLRTVPEEPS